MPSLNDHPELLELQKLIRQKRLEVYIVGGFLRDLMLKRSGHDIDFAVSSGSIALARSFARKIKGSFVLLDEEAGCARVAKKKNNVLWTFDFADFRAPTIKEDLSKRDFTINTFVCDLSELKPGQDIQGKVLPNKKAASDLRSGMVRMTSKEVFMDDPLRVLRAYSHIAQLGFSIHPATKSALKSASKLINKVSPERVREELFKVLESSRSAVTLKAMYEDGVLFTVIPQLNVMEKVEQGGYHHLDVLKHTFLALKNLDKLVSDRSMSDEFSSYLDEKVAGGHSRKAVLKLACLLHDIGKPDTKRKEPDGKTSFHGHEHAGVNISRFIAKQLLLSSKERHLLEDIIAMHLRPGYLANFKKPSDRMVFRFFRDAKDEVASILLHSLADQRATRGKLTSEEHIAHHEKIALALIQEFFRKKNEKPFVRLINGHDLIRRLKLKPGPVFARILKAVEEAQHLGRITTKQEAIDLAAKFVKR